MNPKLNPRSSSSQALAQPPQGGSAPCDPFAQLLAEHEQQLSIVAQLEALSVTDAPLIKSLVHQLAQAERAHTFAEE